MFYFSKGFTFSHFDYQVLALPVQHGSWSILLYKVILRQSWWAEVKKEQTHLNFRSVVMWMTPLDLLLSDARSFDDV